MHILKKLDQEIHYKEKIIKAKVEARKRYKKYMVGKGYSVEDEKNELVIRDNPKVEH